MVNSEAVATHLHSPSEPSRGAVSQHSDHGSPKPSCSSGITTLGSRMFYSGLAGALEMCTFYPMDTISKRVMYDRATHRGSVYERLMSYKGTILMESEGKGLIRITDSLFAGFKYAAIYKVAQRTYQFGTQPIFKEFLDDAGWSKVAHDRIGNRWGEVLVAAIAGAMMGVGELIFVPAAVLKIRAQTHPGCFRGRSLKGILLSEPSGVLWKGWPWTLARNVPGSFGLFGGDELARQYFFKRHADSIFSHFGCTLVGAVTSLVFAAPFDVIKTRLQGSHFGSAESGFQVLMKLLRHEGVGALFKGCTAKIITVGPKLCYGMGCATYLTKTYIDK